MVQVGIRSDSEAVFLAGQPGIRQAGPCTQKKSRKILIRIIDRLSGNGLRAILPQLDGLCNPSRQA